MGTKLSPDVGMGTGKVAKFLRAIVYVSEVVPKFHAV